MKIPLSKIKPSPRAVRKTWDEEALEQLAQSIKEHGLIVPIKVRPDGNGKYEIVYGHRRIKAMRRARIKETEAIVEGVDDTVALVQSLIENVQREDMSPIDQAKALFAIQEETGWSQADMARRGILPEKTISNYMSLLRESPRIQRIVERGAPVGRGGGIHASEGRVTPSHVIEARQSGLAKSEREAVIEKAAKEGLTAQQTRRVAEAVKAAKSERRKKYLLDSDYAPFIHDAEVTKQREEEYADHDPLLVKERKPSAQKDWAETPAVKEVIVTVKMWHDSLTAFKKATEIGKLAPEAKQFLAHKLKPFSRELNEWISELEKRDDP